MHKKSKHSEKVYTCQDNVILVNRIAGLCTVERPVILAILAMNVKIEKLILMSHVEKLKHTKKDHGHTADLCRN